MQQLKNINYVLKESAAVKHTLMAELESMCPHDEVVETSWSYGEYDEMWQTARKCTTCGITEYADDPGYGQSYVFDKLGGKFKYVSRVEFNAVKLKCHADN